MSTRITINLATFPPRKVGFTKRLLELAPQCDLFRVYLNGHKRWPSYVPIPDNVEYICGDGVRAPDLGSQGKLHWLDPTVDEYYLTCDDDIEYAPGYVKHMIEGCRKYGNRGVVTLHGGSFDMPRRQLPYNVCPRDLRKLIAYDKPLDTDIAVMLGGNGIMCCHPMTLGLVKEELVQGPLHSGDDEDIAIWCQKHRVPIVILKHDVGLAICDHMACKIQAQYVNVEYVKKQNIKLRAWIDWLLTPLPCVLKLKEKREDAKMAYEFGDIDLTEDQLAFTNKIMGSDALAAQLITRIKHKQATSLIRMSDGEYGTIDHGQGAKLPWFLATPDWVKEYGMEGSDFRQVGKDLLVAGHKADYLACTISGVYVPHFNVAKFFPERDQFISSFYANQMCATGVWKAILSQAPVIVVHRYCELVSQKLANKYGLDGVTTHRLDSWKDQEAIGEALEGQPYSIVLVSGGPIGKPWMVKLAQETGHCVIDVGAGMTNFVLAGV